MLEINILSKPTFTTAASSYIIIPYFALIFLTWLLSIKQVKLCELSQLPSSQKAASLIPAARLICFGCSAMEFSNLTNEVLCLLLAQNSLPISGTHD